MRMSDFCEQVCKPPSPEPELENQAEVDSPRSVTISPEEEFANNVFVENP